jgi:hypothetical protein
MSNWLDRIEDAWLRFKDLDERLKRTTDPSIRKALRTRKEDAQRDLKSAGQALKEAAERGDRSAREVMDVFETWQAQSADE